MALSFRFHSPYLPQFKQDPLPLFIEGFSAARSHLELCSESRGVEFLIAAVAQLRKKGVRVRWVISLDDLAEKEATETVQKLRHHFREHGMAEGDVWKVIKAPQAKLHPAFCIVDRHKVIWISHPLSLEGMYLQESLSVSAESQEVASAFQRSFETYWDDVESINREILNMPFLPGLVSSTESMTVGPDQLASVYFLPSDQDVIEQKLMEAIQEADESIFFALPNLENPELVDALEDAVKSGLSVHGILDAHQAHVDHFWRAPHLRQFALSGKIRFTRGFAKQGNLLLDLVQLKLVVADQRSVFCAAERFNTRRGNHSADVRWRGESAWQFESLSIAKQAISAIEAWREMAKQGGHQFAIWGYADRYPFPKEWAERPKPVERSKTKLTLKKKPDSKRVAKPVAKKKTVKKKPVAKKKVSSRKRAA